MLAGNQWRGTGSYPMRTTDQSPVRARAVTSGPTGRVHSLPRSTSRSQAARLYATGSRFSVTAIETSLCPGGTFEKPDSGHAGTISLTVPDAPGQLERHETPDPVRSDAVNPGFHGVWRGAGGRQARGGRQAAGARAAGRQAAGRGGQGETRTRV